MLSQLRVPLELYHEIICYLWDDRKSLSACSLAGRTLTVASQKLLFYQIILDTHAGISSAFHKLLETSPHIADYVQCLQIFDIDEPEKSFIIHWPADRDRWLPNDPFLPLFSPLLRNLKAFILYHDPDWDLCDQVQHSMQDLIRRPSLVHIDLDVYSWILLHQSVSANLKHLIIRGNNHSPTILMPPEPSTCSPIYLETLVLGSAEQTFLIPFTSDPNFRFETSHLRILLLEIETDEIFQHVGIWPLLLSCRETLEQLTFTFLIRFSSQTDVRARRSTPIDLSQMTALKKFTLYLDTTPPFLDVWDPLWCFNNLLKSASSTLQRLEDIVLIMELRGKRFDPCYWNELCDFFLNPSRCPRLRKVAINAMDGGNGASLENSESLEKLRARLGTEGVTVAFDIPSLEVDLPDKRWENVEFGN